MSISIAAISDQPGLAPIVAEWLVQAFGHSGGRSVEDMTALIQSPPVGPEETFVLFEQDRPVGTASLAAKDLQTRPDLTPWLAGVFVHPAFRGRGYATVLVRKVEAFATAASLRDVWLYTWTAEPLYARLGWHKVGLEQNRGSEVVLMRRSLAEK